MTCGGCEGAGAHRRWCVAVVGYMASHLGRQSEQAEALADEVGSACPGAANHLYVAGSLLRTEANEARRRHETA
jgi:hypothetical protein